MRTGFSMALDAVPFVDTVKGIQEVLTGVDLITGQHLSVADRVAEGAGTLLSFLPDGKILGTFLTKEAIDGGAWAWKQVGKEAVEETVGEVKTQGYRLKANLQLFAGSTGKTVKNDIIDLERIGSALKNDKVKPIYDNGGNILKEYPAKPKAHGFSDLINNYAGDAVKTKLPDGADLYQLGGTYNHVAGRFEWIIENGKVTHRMFIENGSMNGVPIKP